MCAFNRSASACQSNHSSDSEVPKVLSGRGKSYCLIHRRYFETSWCPECGRSKYSLYLAPFIVLLLC
ncbi:uncharacterized protein BYT42DRAFT_505992 [Radiomyces spectabilis]|uniref:uncharacterized protein n=1 Tax=Radiomyces spectabilis TaxID=64574 RepID=UPI00221F3695|nr:uncharacterized protein BYT42DRAFT_505992 [Radiomyces spectabilis]KAI8364728.1 hypothetical protein BYT42DRAFT_505992 [Radiomyces spectabilis]